MRSSRPILAALAVLVWLGPGREAVAAPRLEIRVLDVGYGQSILIRLPHGQDWLVDGGLGIRNAGLLKRLRRLGVRQIDRLICTHPHPDHVEGLVGILETIPVRRVSLNHPPDHPRFYPPLLDHLIRHPEVEWEVLRRGQVLRPSSEVEVHILHPDSLAPEDMNDSSLVFRLRYRGFRFLQGGDLTAEAQRDLVQTAPDELACDVVYVPHHGGKGDPSFREAVGARIGIISVGPNAWGPPDPGTLEGFQKSGTRLIRTDRDGEIRIRTDGRRVDVSGARTGRLDRWQLAVPPSSR